MEDNLFYERLLLENDILKWYFKYLWSDISAWVFPCKSAAFFRHPFLKNTPGRLLLLNASGWKNFVYHKIQVASSSYTLLSDNTIEVVWMNKEY